MVSRRGYMSEPRALRLTDVRQSYDSRVPYRSIASWSVQIPWLTCRTRSPSRIRESKWRAAQGVGAGRGAGCRCARTAVNPHGTSLREWMQKRALGRAPGVPEQVLCQTGPPAMTVRGLSYLLFPAEFSASGGPLRSLDERRGVDIR